MTICRWCKEPLIWTDRGWVHSDGQVYKTKPDPKRPGQWIDDHCAFAIDVKTAEGWASAE